MIVAYLSNLGVADSLHEILEIFLVQVLRVDAGEFTGIKCLLSESLGVYISVTTALSLPLV